MKINAKFFAVARDRTGVQEDLLELPVGATVALAVQALLEKYPALHDIAARAAYAINRSYVRTDALLNDGDELAVIPPVSGG